MGASTAWQLKQKYPAKRILLLEKEADFAQHQTGHNSGVIHAGVYYQPGSLKADFCKRGVQATIGFCQRHGIDVENCGKLIVATTDDELERMQHFLNVASKTKLTLNCSTKLNSNWLSLTLRA